MRDDTIDAGHARNPRALTALVVLVLLLSGRAMTLAFLARVGDAGPGDPPLAWRLPLLGDAVIGLAAPVVAYLAIKGRTIAAWTAIVAWNVIGMWDALSAYVVHTTTPWPSFFMVRAFGSSMFFAATAMHAVALWLTTRDDVTRRFGVALHRH